MHWLRCLLLITIVGISGIADAATADSDPAATLRAKYAALQEQLRKNQFKRPLVLDSAETPSHLKGDIYAIVDYPFGAVNAGLNNPDHWCDVMLLHINTKYCHAMVEPSGTNLRLHIGRKTPEELATAPRLDFHYSIVTDTPQYIEIMLSAKDGPLGTSDYLILLEAVALPNAKTFLHLTYSYAMNISARLAMQTYLGTIGSDKVGFTVIGKRANGEPDYVGGVRGLVERNTMRYYLAIDAFLEAASAAPPAQFERRLQSWFTATERYSQQLHEMSRQQYLEMKRAEYVRQQTVY
ncbi:MAG: hypothetical protein HHJ09_10330 [Glaciimonas sp.]|nr:hypothetical protein [Glaciimonas sp.]